MVALAQALAQVAVYLCAIVTGFKLEDHRFHVGGESVSKAARHEDGRMYGPSSGNGPSDLRRGGKEYAAERAEDTLVTGTVSLRRQVSDGRGEYEGETAEGKRHGKGTFVYRNGDKYEGEWAEGKKNGTGTMFFKNGEKYVEWAEDEMHGNGTFDYGNFENYVGEWAKGKKSGTGTMVFNDGNKYVGEWAEDEMHGKGTYIKRNGHNYTGDLAKGKAHGKGTFVKRNGDKYTGDWAEGKKHGKGTYFYGNGDKYEGEWAKGKKNGTGTMVFNNGNKYVGEWADGAMHGKGMYLHRNGGRYMGEWAEGKKNGKGIVVSSDGSLQVARWKYGKLARDENRLLSECSMLEDDRGSLVHLADYTDLHLNPKERQQFQLVTDSPYNNKYKYVLFLHTSREGDHSGAFRFSNGLCARIRCWAKRGFGVALRHAKSVEHATEVLSSFPDRPLHHVEIGGHGARACNSVTFGSNKLDIDEPSESLRQFIKALGEKTRFDASVTLFACNTAKQRCHPDKLNVFQVLAGYLPGRRVLGATDLLTTGGYYGERSFQPDAQEVNMDASDDADTCLTGDRAIFYSKTLGDVAYAIAPRGQPLCSDLSRNDLARIKVCKTHCGGDCLKVRFLGEGPVRLQPAEGVPDDRENMCPLRKYGEKRAICYTTLADGTTRGMTSK